MDFMNHTYGRNAMNIYSAPTMGKRQMMAKHDKFSVKDLSKDEIDKIFTLYGALVEDVMPLTESQAWLFSNDMIVSENFYIQALFKVNGTIRPQIFNERIEELIKQHKILRTVFLCGGQRRPLQIVLKSRTAEIRFHDISKQTKEEIGRTLEKIMASDRRRGFDLMKDRLLRIGVFRTDIKEYAVLIAQPHLVADSWDFGQIFADLFFDEESDCRVARQLKTKNFSFTKYLQKRGEQDKTLAITYWKKLLCGLSGISMIPGYKKRECSYQQAVSSINVNQELTKKLQRLAVNNTGLIALLQAVWGIMLQHYNRSNDAVYGTILSNRTAKLDNIEESAGIINVMPIRVTCSIDMPFDELRKKQQMQLVLSQPYSYCTPQDFQIISETQEPLFNHFLNFHGFGMKALYTDVKAPFGVTPVCVNSFDTRNADFGIYFGMNFSGLNMEFVYNNAVLTKNQIELLQQGFLAVLRQVVQKPEIQICEIKMPSIEQIYSAAVDERTIKEEIRRFLSEVSLFHNLSELVIEELVNLAKMEYFVEGDVICSEGAKQEKLYVVYSGNVEISRSAENGWAGSLKILKRGSVLGYEGILDQRPSSVRAEALIGDVRMISIANRELSIMMRKNFDLVINVMSELNEQVNKFQKLWISAE